MKVSVVIPTHNRCASVQRTLDALACDPEIVDAGEVIVVADGCRDGTARVLRGRTWPWPFQVLEMNPGRGVSEARNAGARLARGRILLFLDDDVEPSPGLVRQHLEAHPPGANRGAVGAYPPALEGPAAPIHILKRDWWLGRFHEMEDPGHRFDYRDLLTGNLSIPATLFRDLNGFDSAIGPAHEDYEFGIRLLAAGGEIVFLPHARALHHEHQTTDLAGFLRRARHEGLADVRILERHPDMRKVLPLRNNRGGNKHTRLARVAAWRRGHLGAMFPVVLMPLVWMTGRVGAKQRWLRLCGVLREYWYWRGVTDAVSDRDALERLLAHRNRFEGTEMVLDLANGLEAAERELDKARPAGLRLRYGRFPVGRIRPAPAAEPLRGRHLRRLLVNDFAWPLLMAKAAHEALDLEPDAQLATTAYGLVSRKDEPLGWIRPEGPNWRERKNLSGRVATELAYPLLLHAGPNWFTPRPRGSGLRELSVVVVAHEGGLSLDRCVQGLSNQRIPPAEVLVVGTSPDVSPPAWGDLRWLGTAAGPAAARNLGWRMATSELVAFTDDLSRPSPAWLERLGDAFTPETSVAGGLVVAEGVETPEQAWYDQLRDGAARGLHRFYIDDASLSKLSVRLWGCFFEKCNFAVRRQVLSELGGFDESMDGFGDESHRDFGYRFLRAGGRLVYEPAALVSYIPPVGPGAVSRQAFEIGRGFAAYLLRRRNSVPARKLARFAAAQWCRRRLYARLRYPGELPRRLVLLEIAGAVWPTPFDKPPRPNKGTAVAGPIVSGRAFGNARLVHSNNRNEHKPR